MGLRGSRPGLQALSSRIPIEDGWVTRMRKSVEDAEHRGNAEGGV